MQNNIFGKHTGFQVAVDLNLSYLQWVHAQALCGKHVANLSCADAERQCPKCSVSRGVRVTASDSHARVYHSEFRSDHMDNALVCRTFFKEPYVELRSIVVQGLRHSFGLQIPIRPGLIGCWNDVVDRRNCSVGKQHAQVALSQHVAGLRTGYFMDQVQADKQLILSGLQLTDRMLIPNLVIECTDSHFYPSYVK